MKILVTDMLAFFKYPKDSPVSFPMIELEAVDGRYREELSSTALGFLWDNTLYIWR